MKFHNRITVKNIGWLVGILLLLGSIFLMTSNSARTKVEGSLGIQLPKSAKNIVVSYQFSAGLKVIKLWAMMDMSLTDAKAISKKMRAQPVEREYWRIIPQEAPTWWSEFRHNGVSDVENKWLRTGSELRPGELYLVWMDGKFYIYHYGYYGLFDRD